MDEFEREIKEIMDEIREVNMDVYSGTLTTIQNMQREFDQTNEDPEYDPAEDFMVIMVNGKKFPIPLLSVDILNTVMNAVNDIKAFCQSEMRE